jgi:hypothetical protein
VNVPAIFKHIKNIYASAELESGATVSKMEIVRQEGKRRVRRAVDHYNLDMIISVGYRVNSVRGTRFRIWATNVLRQHLVQGYTLHERRLKELNQAVRLIADVAQRRSPGGDGAAHRREPPGREGRADAGGGELDQPAQRVSRKGLIGRDRSGVETHESRIGAQTCLTTP